jgi:type III secretion system low calcium response chaperone LcrH/SycD
MPITDQEIEDILRHHENLATRIAAGESTLAEVLKLSSEELEALYAMAYNQYEHRKYDEARRIFAMLTLFAPTSYTYTLGLALSVYRTGDLGEAATAFAHCLLLDPLRPEAYLYHAECMFRLGHMESVRESLEQAVLLSEDEEEFAHLHSRARVMLENLDV